ncbi:uncharacterized protein VNE69_09135 [Vairimorpha necatrix]|uniref:Uncharacterized protein n=1 Tax=Vairimorpha necatrix TaxID=6039 RepID=A0AAX4JF21_9MICR
MYLCKMFLRLKITTKDYLSSDRGKGKNYINIYTYYNCKNREFLFIYQKFTPNDNKYNGKLTILKENKSFVQIIEEIEDIIITTSYDPYKYAYVFIYEKNDYEKFSDIKELVEELKKTNALRRLNREGAEINYENICCNCDLLQEIITVFRSFRNVSYLEPQSSICFYKNFQTKKEFILIIIDIDVKINKVCQGDETILRKLLDIYKLSDKNYHLPTFRNQKLRNEYKTSGIYIKDKDSLITIDIKNTKILFKTREKRAYFHLKKASSKNENLFYISSNCYNEFQKIFSRLSSLEFTERIELFFNLLKNHNKMIFFVERIVNKPETALNMIFVYLMYNNYIVNENTFYFMIENKNDKYLEEDIFGKDLYLIIFCLIIEAETYIQENNFSEDKLFVTLTEIGDIINEKNNEASSATKTTKKNINLLKIFKEIVILHNNTIHKYRDEYIALVCKTAALFTGLSSISIYEYKHQLIENNKIEKQTAVTDLNLNASEIEQNVEELIKKLKEKNGDL